MNERRTRDAKCLQTRAKKQADSGTCRNRPTGDLGGLPTLAKCPTGIPGLDEVTNGGIPRDRPTLICGGSGGGKTLLAMQFLVRGIEEHGEPGVFMCFEERESDLAANVASLGFDLPALIAQKKLVVDQVTIDRDEILETGEYNLDGLFIRLGAAIDTVGAKRVVLEALFAALTNLHILRSELRRLFLWLKEKGVTAIVTGERADGSLTRRSLEEYVSDCVILLDQKVADEVATRRLRVVMYRGSAGTGKTSIAASFTDAACRRGERRVYFAFEESPDQIVRNMRSIGVDLGPWIDKGLLHIVGTRPASFGLEVHLSAMVNLVDTIKPRAVVLDPVSSFQAAGTPRDARAMLVRLVDLLKTRQITAMFTSLTGGGRPAEQSEVGLSSLIDTWVMLRNLEQAGERSRTLSLIKSRGMKHSNQARELLLTEKGVELAEIFVGPDGAIMIGSARAAQKAADHAADMALQQDIARKKDAIARKRKVTETRIAEMRAELDVETVDFDIATAQQVATAGTLRWSRATLAGAREQAGGSRTKFANGGGR